MNLRDSTSLNILLSSKIVGMPLWMLPSEVIIYYFQIFLVLTKFQLLLKIDLNENNLFILPLSLLRLG